MAQTAASEGGSEMHFEQTWDRILQRLIAEYGQNVFQSWFARLQFVGIDNGLAVLSVPTPFLRSWIRDNYQVRIAAMWKEEEPDVGGVDIRLRGPVLRSMARAEDAEEQAPAAPRLALAGAGGNTVTATGGDGIPLDPKLTFDSFVTSPTNTLAYAAAVEVAGNSTAPRYNPLFIHGGVGRGKTHLLHAIVWDVRKRNPKRKVRLLSTDMFMLKFVSSARDNDTVSFKNMLRDTDLLLIDDLQFLQGKGTHREFAYTVNALVESGKQIVAVADRAPARLDVFEERIRSRLAGGLTVEIGAPDMTLRRAILDGRLDALKREAPDFVLDEEVLGFISRHLATTSRAR